jgi:hypothetical protein
LETVTDTEAVVACPARSLATAATVWLPFDMPAVFQEPEYGATKSSAPRLLPSTLNWTPTTPVSSDAVAVSGTVPDMADPETGEVRETVGGTVSVGTTAFDTVTVTGSDAVTLPARSLATAVTVWEPFDMPAVFQEPEYGATKSSAPRLLPSTLNWTPTTPTLSEAEALRDTRLDTVPAKGEDMDMTGAVVSGGGVTVTVTDFAAVPPAPVQDMVSVVETGSVADMEASAVLSNAAVPERAPPFQAEPSPPFKRGKELIAQAVALVEDHVRADDWD